MTLSGAFAVLGVTGCLAADPTTACEARSFEVEIEPLLADSERVLAVANPGGSVTVWRHRCDRESVEDGDCSIGADLIEDRITIADNPHVDQLLMSASGRWLVVRTDRRLLTIDLNAPSEMNGAFTPTIGPTDADNLIGALRSGDWIVYRSGSQLAAYNLTTLETVLLGEPGMDLFAVAMGDRHVVARRHAGGGRHELHMLTVDPYGPEDFTRPGDSTLLATEERAFSRVEITRGTTPAGSSTPLDHRIIATSGTNPETAITRVFDAQSGDNLDAFRGAVVTSATPLTNIEGLSATSPDGLAVAYITPSRSVALHQLDGRGGCLVRSGRSATHDLAGFSADGELFFQGTQGTKSGAGVAHKAIFSYSSQSLAIDRLTPATSSYSLKAVPQGMFSPSYDTHAGDTLPWAVATTGGSRYVVQANASPAPVSFGDSTYLPRRVASGAHADQGLYLVEARETNDNEDLVEYAVARLTARPGDAEGRRVVFDVDQPTVCDNSGDADCVDMPSYDGAAISAEFHKSDDVCVSTPRIEGWARDCFRAKESNGLSPRLPATESQ